MKTLRVISAITLLTFSLNSAAFADSLKFDQATAQKMDGDLNFYRKGLDACTTLNGNYVKLGAAQDKEIDTLKAKADSLNLNLTTAMKAEADYKDLYVKTDQARLKAEADKPSRTLWFTIGATTAAILVAVLAVYIKK